MHIYTQLTAEQRKINNKNKKAADEYFQLQKGWVLHHKDETLRSSDIERYIEWRPEDLIPMPKSEHSKLHMLGNQFNKGKNNRLGCHLTEEHKHKISEANKGNKYSLGRQLTEETRQKIAKANGGRNFICEETGKIYYSANQAARELGISQGNLTSHLHGSTGYSHVGGYHFHYIEAT